MDTAGMKQVASVTDGCVAEPLMDRPINKATQASKLRSSLKKDKEQ